MTVLHLVGVAEELNNYSGIWYRRN